MPLDDGKLRDIMDEMHKTLMKKNALYEDAVFEFGELGILIRAYDKVKRLRALLERGAVPLIEQGIVKDIEEWKARLEDAWLDLAGYALLGLYYRRNRRVLTATHQSKQQY